jgi:hypothetical protein
MASASSFLGGDYLKGEVLKASGPVRGTISGVTIDTFKGQNGKPDEQKLSCVVDLGTEEKKVTLNKTNLRVIIGAYGDDTDKWVGRPIVVYYDPNVSFGGRTIGGVRVKVPTTQAPLAQQQQAVNAAPAAPAAPATDGLETVGADIPF